MTQVRWDQDRESRTGVPEVIFGPGKTSAHLRQLFENTSELRMASRLSEEQMQVLSDLATIYPEARMAVRNPREKRVMPVVPVITAGTADIPVALEAATTLDAMGVPTATHFDVGVAGIHRLQSILPEITGARAVTGDRCSDIDRNWRCTRWNSGAQHHARKLQPRRCSSEHRQWIRRRVPRTKDPRKRETRLAKRSSKTKWAYSCPNRLD